MKQGTVQLMHHRRIAKDDGRGMGDPLNETDETGQGITVSTKYYLHTFDRQRE